MNFEELCIEKGGVFQKGKGCFLLNHEVTERRFAHDFPGQEGRRLYYETTKAECEKNGDEYVIFDPLLGMESKSTDEPPGLFISACKELGPSEVCERDVDWHKKHDIAAIGEPTRIEGWGTNYNSQLEACMKTIQFSEHKLNKLMERKDGTILTYILINQKLSSTQINWVIEEQYEYLTTLLGIASSDEKRKGKPYHHLSSENIDTILSSTNVIAQEYGLHELFSYHTLSQKQIEKAIGLGKKLEYLYNVNNQTLDEKNIERGIKKGVALHHLFSQKMTPALIDMAMEDIHVRGAELASLYEIQKLTPEQIEKAIENDKGGLHGLFVSKKNHLTPKQVDKIINTSSYSATRTTDLRALYQKYTLTPKQVDVAITKGMALEILVQKQHLTDEQITRIIKTCEGEELWALYSKKNALSPKHIDLALAENQNYIAMLYQYQKMTPAQIEKALNIGINREAIYANQKLLDTQVASAIKHELNGEDNDLQLRQLFSNQVFSDSHIDYIIKEAEKNHHDNVLRMFMDHQHNRLNKKQIKDVITFADTKSAQSHYDTVELVNMLFESQQMDAESIDYCIEKDVELQIIYNTYGEMFKQQNVKKALAKGKYYHEIFKHIKLTKTQIDEALGAKLEMPSLIGSEINILTPDQIEYIIRNGDVGALRSLYSTYTLGGKGEVKKTIDHNIIDLAINRGEGLSELYQHNKLLSTEIDDAITRGFELYYLYCNVENTFTKENYKHAIRVNAGLSNLYTCQKNLEPEIIDLAITAGNALHELYEHQKLNPAQLNKALERGEELSQLYTYQLQNFKPEHFDILIPNADKNLLFKLYKDVSLDISESQRELIAKKLSTILNHVIPPGSIVHNELHPDYWEEYELKKQNAIDTRITERPLETLIGVYPLSVENPWEDIIKYVKEKGFRVSEDGKYAVDKQDPKKQVRLGKLLFRDLKSEQHPMMKKYKVLMSQKIKPTKFTSAALPKQDIENLEIVISNDPNDIAAKGIGHKYIRNTCEAVKTGMYGWVEWDKDELEGKKRAPPGKGCGWCDDIRDNNLIAYLRNTKEKDPRKKWFDRAMIRWCIRDDDKKPDAIIETVYGEEKYKPLIRELLTKILNRNGFTGSTDGHMCVTPYTFTGYADHATHPHPSNGGKAEVIKTYNLDERPASRV